MCLCLAELLYFTGMCVCARSYIWVLIYVGVRMPVCGGQKKMVDVISQALPNFWD